jgi:hypothetical protein
MPNGCWVIHIPVAFPISWVWVMLEIRTKQHIPFNSAMCVHGYVPRYSRARLGFQASTPLGDEALSHSWFYWSYLIFQVCALPIKLLISSTPVPHYHGSYASLYSYICFQTQGGFSPPDKRLQQFCKTWTGRHYCMRIQISKWCLLYIMIP